MYCTRHLGGSFEGYLELWLRNSPSTTVFDGLKLATWEEEGVASRSSFDTRLKVKGL